MLADREHVEPDLVGLLGNANDRVDPLRLARRVAAYRVSCDVADGEDSELHRWPLCLPEYLYDCACSIHDSACISHAWRGQRGVLFRVRHGDHIVSVHTLHSRAEHSRIQLEGTVAYHWT